MSVRYVEHRNDDLDGAEGASLHQFAIEGVPYEIDLTDENWEKFLGAIHPYVAAGRRVSKVHANMSRSRRASRKVTRAATPVDLGAPAGNGALQEADLTREQRNAIREWAKSQGIDVSSRGRLKQQIVSMWDAAQRNGEEKLETIPAAASTRRVVRRRATSEEGTAKGNGRKAKAEAA